MQIYIQQHWRHNVKNNNVLTPTLNSIKTLLTDRLTSKEFTNNKDINKFMWFVTCICKKNGYRLEAISERKLLIICECMLANKTFEQIIKAAS
jgi:hypothetical protein